MNAIITKAENLAEQIYKYYRNDRGSVVLTLNNTVFVFKVNAMDNGLMIECNDKIILNISGWDSSKVSYYGRGDVIHILIHFFKLLQLNENESALKLRAGKLFIKQLKQVYASRESISLRHFDFKSEFKITTFNKKIILSKEKIPISKHPEIYQFNLQSYPDLGRGSIVANYYGIDNIDKLKVSDVIISKKGVNYVVIHKKSQNSDILAMVVKNKEVSKHLPINDCIKDTDIVYLISNDTLDNVWDALFSCNRVGKRRKRF